MRHNHVAEETAVIGLSLNMTPTFTVTVQYSTIGGTAIPNQDYLPVSGTLSFVPGVTQQTFIVSLVDDTLLDGDKYVELVLADVVNGLLGLNASKLIIQDNEIAYSIYFPAIRKP